MTKTIDLNADLGESFGHYSIGDDVALLGIVTSANVACGFHGGDPQVMAKTFALAHENNVAVGAHPGFPDLWGFGRRPLPMTPLEIERIVAYQLGAACAMATYSGHAITYLKAHGALANLTEHDPVIAEAVLNGVYAVEPSLPIVAIAHSALEQLGRDRGMTIRSEIFADRGYDEDGHLLPRAQPGAVLHDPQAVAERALRMIHAGAIETLSGRLLATTIDTICVHGDSAEAVTLARHLRNTLEAEGILVRAPAKQGHAS
ncbi:LamB/YcsF family protein [Acetobacter persici]|uniref:LamB/YcsF family protein n=1 Tax=Acetobacter persici TaxID=1076596 RepID=UPI001BA683BF|nr:5-oxoprolinase subunit PxpA [Acetobacter persici]MBS1014362.1 LamB/YcsF family protein [Acetobacter persici]